MLSTVWLYNWLLLYFPFVQLPCDNRFSSCFQYKLVGNTGYRVSHKKCCMKLNFYLTSFSTFRKSIFIIEHVIIIVLIKLFWKENVTLQLVKMGPICSRCICIFTYIYEWINIFICSKYMNIYPTDFLYYIKKKF